MEPIWADLILGERAIRALAWTLLHSLWIGLGVAILAGLVILVTRKSSPVLRYNVLSGIFGFFILACAYTFLVEIGNSRDSKTSADSGLSLQWQQHSEHQPASQVFLQSDDRLGGILNFLNGHESTIVNIWFIIFCIQFMRLLLNMVYMQRLRRYKVHAASPEWNEKLRELACRMGIRKRIDLLQSEWIRIPVMAGLFKPLILFPFSLLAQLPPEQVEAILLHELAHMKRRDYFMNILQRLTEIIFFFNPGLLWISGLIREERENCCDDMALEHAGSNRHFIHALLAFGQDQPSIPDLAIAFPGRKNQLLHRIKRILYHKNQTLSTMEKIFLAGSLVLVSGIALAFSTTHRANHVPGPIQGQLSSSSSHPELADAGTSREYGFYQQDTVPSGKKIKKDNVIITRDGQTIYVQEGYKIVTNDEGKIIEVYKNGVRLSAEKLASQKPYFEKMISDEQADLAKKEYTLLLDQKIAMANQVLAQKALKDALVSKQVLEKLALDAQVHMNESQNLALKQKLEELQAQMSALDLEKMKKDQEEISASNELLSQLINSQSNQRMGVVDQIIKTLWEKKIIGDQTDLSFELNDEQLVVNNQPQPAELHRELKTRFLKKPKDHVIYEAKKGSIHTDIFFDEP